MNRNCLALLAAYVAAPISADSSHAKAAEPARPNVLFLFTDDQRADTIAALGNPAIKTPHLDRLVQTGFTFRNAYCLGSNVGAVCSPSRNMLLSGRAYFRFGKMAERSKPNFARSMREAGYETYHHGKTGNTAKELHKEFDHSHYLKDLEARTCGEPGREVVDDAVTFLKTRKREKPFFMYLAFATPHDPRVAAAKYLAEYQRENIPLPTNYLPTHPFDNGEMTVRDEQLAPWPRTEDTVRKHLHDYYAAITGLDHHIGRLLAYLKETGQYENTIIIFSSDHGLALGSHGLFGKQSLYEHSMKPPLVVTGPGIPHGETAALAYLLDIFPTTCALVGTEIPAGLDGQNLAPVIQGKQSKVRDTLFTSYRNVQRAVRDDRWKLIQYPLINKTQLFDLQADPEEQHDLADDTAQAPRIAELMKSMRAWQTELGDDAPLTSENPAPEAWTAPAKKPGAKKGAANRSPGKPAGGK